MQETVKISGSDFDIPLWGTYEPNGERFVAETKDGSQDLQCDTEEDAINWLIDYTLEQMNFVKVGPRSFVHKSNL